MNELLTMYYRLSINSNEILIRLGETTVYIKTKPFWI